MLLNKPASWLRFALIAAYLVAVPFQTASANKTKPYPLLMNHIAAYVETYYINPERINPEKMLTHYTRSLERSVKEFKCDYLKKNKQVIISMGTRSTSLKIKRLVRMSDFSIIAEQIFDYVRNNYTGEQDIHYIHYAAARAALATLDPHSTVFTADETKEFFIKTSGNFEGVGMVIGVKNNVLTAVAPIKGSPALRAGIQSGDRIMAIDNVPTVNMSIMEAVHRIRGPKGTKVVLKVQRKGKDKWMNVPIIRDKINVPSVTAACIKDGIGYIQISQFKGNTLDQLKKKLVALHSGEIAPIHTDGTKVTDPPESRLKGLILDFRKNSGGLLDQAVKIANLFLKKGTIVITSTSNRKSKETASVAGTQGDYPLIVLINNGSASASEIVTGALKKNNRALLMGRKTFGKGSIQNPFQLNNNAMLKLTIGEYLLPGGVSIQNHGVYPDIRFDKVVVEDDKFNIIPDKPVFLEKDFDVHLPDGDVAPEEKCPFILSTLVPEAESDKDKKKEEDSDTDTNKIYKDEFDFTKDPEVLAAVEIIQKWPKEKIWTRESALADENKIIRSIISRESSEISAALREKYSIDWSLGPGVPSPGITISAPKSISQARAGETADVAISITNNSDKPLYRVHGIPDSKKYYLSNYEDNREFIWGLIPPGKTVTATAKFKIPEFLDTRRETVKVDIFDVDNKIGHTEFPVEILSIPHPEFECSYILHDGGTENSKGNSDGKLQVGELIEIQCSVTNSGNVESKENEFVVLFKSEKYTGDKPIILKKGYYNDVPISQGASKDFSFTFEVGKPAETKFPVMHIQIKDYTYSEILDIPIKNIKVNYTPLCNQRFQAVKPAIQFLSPKPPKDAAVVSEKSTFQLKISDSKTSPADCFYLYNGKDKAGYISRTKDSSDPLVLDCILDLKEGNNIIYIIAEKKSGIASTRTLSIFHAPPPDTKATAAKPAPSTPSAK